MQNDINERIGHNIRAFRKNKGLTLVEFSNLLYKSKATISKYERGEIALDIPTLYEIANIFDVHVNQLLVFDQVRNNRAPVATPGFFQNVSRLYSYLYDGRTGKIMRNVFDIIPNVDGKNDTVYMYMNVNSYEDYQNCENTYSGEIIHFDATSTMILENIHTPMGKAYINILASFLDAQTKWGLFTGLSIRPMMPIATKMLFSKKLLDETAIVDSLLISDEDIQKMKYYNMFSVT